MRGANGRGGRTGFHCGRKQQKLEEVKKSIESAGGICDYLSCDVSSEEDCKKLIGACISQFGRIDILVNNAGTSGSTAKMEDQFKTEHYQAVMKTDFDSVFMMIKYAYPECAKNGVGSIINISSSAALKAAGPIVYTAAKGAIKSMTRVLAKNFGPMNVRINSIYPGMIDTEMTHSALATPEGEAMFKAMSPLGLIGQPDDIAYGALYLASDAARFVTGQDLVIDGGFTC